MTKERVTAFIDAVLAIVMTILVLEMKAPDQVTMVAFGRGGTNLFPISFLLICG